MIDPTAPRHREQGGFSAALGAFVLALLIGGGIGVAVRRSQPARLPVIALSASGPTSIATDTTLEPAVTLELGTTIETTTPVTEVVTEPPVTDPPTTVPETAAPTTEPQLQADISTSAKDSILQAPGTLDRRIVDLSLGCDGFSASQAPGSAKSCDDLSFGDRKGKWVVSTDGALNILLLADVPNANAAGDVWDLALTGSDAGRSGAPTVADVSGDGSPDLIVAWNDGGRLKVDVATLTQLGMAPSMHLDLPSGRARVNGGKLNVWFDAGDLGKLTHAVIERNGDVWKPKAIERVNVEDAPQSEL
jgi:hypothetical protein